MSEQFSGGEWTNGEPVDEECGANVMVHKKISTMLNCMENENEHIPTGSTKPNDLDSEVFPDGYTTKNPSLQDDRFENGANGHGLVHNGETITADTSKQNSKIGKLETEIELFLTEHNAAKVRNQFFGRDRLIFGTVGPDGGTLILSDPFSGRPIQMSIGKDALEKDQTIYMEVEASEFSPKIKLGPSGTTFKKPIHLTFPVNKSAVSLRLRKRENEASEWREDPDKTPYLEHDGICALELSSFSDYEMAPVDALGVTLLVYIQGAETHTGLCLRVYLSQESQIQRIEELELGLSGVCIKRYRVYVLDKAYIQVNESTGLTSLDPDNIRTVTRAVLAKNQMYGSGFMFKCEPRTNRRELQLNLIRVQYEMFQRNIEVVLPRDDFSPESRAMGSLCCNLEPIQQPIGLFPRNMIEDLLDLLNSKTEAVYKLADSIGMPGCKPIPRGQLIKFGESSARFVLDFYQYLCQERGIEKKEGLQMLQERLNTLDLPEEARVVGDYVAAVLALRPKERSTGEAVQSDSAYLSGCNDPLISSVDNVEGNSD